MRRYRWICKVCGLENEAGEHTCARCLNPAVLSSLEAGFLRRERDGESHPVAEVKELQFQKSLDQLSPVKRILAYLCLAPIMLAAILLKFMFWSIWTLGAVIIGALAYLALDLLLSQKLPVKDIDS